MDDYPEDWTDDEEVAPAPAVVKESKAAAVAPMEDDWGEAADEVQAEEAVAGEEAAAEEQVEDEVAAEEPAEDAAGEEEEDSDDDPEVAALEAAIAAQCAAASGKATPAPVRPPITKTAPAARPPIVKSAPLASAAGRIQAAAAGKSAGKGLGKQLKGSPAQGMNVIRKGMPLTIGKGTGKDKGVIKGAGKPHSLPAGIVGKGAAAGSKGKGGLVLKGKGGYKGAAASAASEAPAKGKGKDKAASQLGMRVIELNRKGWWPAGKGVDVKALHALKAIDVRVAGAILDELEAEGGDLKNPSTFIQTQIQAKSGKLSSAALASAGQKGGAKRPASVPASAPPAKRAAVAAAADGDEEWEEEVEPEQAAEEEEVYEEEEEAAPVIELPPAVAAKVSALEKKGHSITEEAKACLAAAEQRDALVVMEALTMKLAKAEVKNPTSFVLVSLRKASERRAAAAGKAAPEEKAPVAKSPVAKAPVSKAPVAETPVAKAPVSKAPVTKAPVSKAPVSKAPVTKAPVAKSPVAKAPVTKAPVAKSPVTKAPVAKSPVAKAPVAKAPASAAAAEVPSLAGAGKPPKTRQGLEYEQVAMQAKVMHMNKLGMWEGAHAIDESAFAAMLRISCGRAMEILEEAEDLGGKVADPTKFILNLVAEEDSKGGV